MKKPTAERLQEAREARAMAKTKYDAVAAKLGTPDWKEDTDGPALETERRALEEAQTLIDRLTDSLELERRSLGDNAGDNGGTPGVSVNVITNPTRDADLPKRYSVLRSIRIKYGIRNAQDQLEKNDGVEAEMMQEGDREARSAQIEDLSPDGFRVPSMCSYSRRTADPERERRDMVAGTGSAGGFTVATDLGGLIPFLDPDTPLMSLGASVLTGLVGNLDIPRQSARATGYPVAEQGAITESQQTLQKLSLSPKRQGSFTEFSMQLVRQSSMDVENWLREDLRIVLMVLQEQYAIQGTGTGSQPTGITATAGIGSVVGGTNGAVPSWSNIVNLETTVANANALRGNRLGYLTTPGIAGALKQAKRDVAGNGFIWEGPNNGNGQMNGYRAATSSLVPSNLTKGTSNGICHGILFGNWRELIMAYWGGVEIIVNPYSLDTTGTYRITANAFFDVGVRRAQSFAAMLDALAA